MFEKQITEICIILIVAFFALIAPQVFVPVLTGMLIATVQEKKNG
jgi:type III secretory pathway component EscS